MSDRFTRALRNGEIEYCSECKKKPVNNRSGVCWKCKGDSDQKKVCTKCNNIFIPKKDQTNSICSKHASRRPRPSSDDDFTLYAESDVR